MAWTAQERADVEAVLAEVAAWMGGDSWSDYDRQVAYGFLCRHRAERVIAAIRRCASECVGPLTIDVIGPRIYPRTAPGPRQ